MIAMLAAVLTALVVYVFLGAQEKVPNERQTTQWNIPLDWNPFMSVHIIDTSGVCLYTLGNNGIAAVSKKDLPMGTGCQ